MKKFSLLLSFMLLLTVVLSGCGSGDSSKDGDKDSESTFKVGMVTDTGGIDDKSFNQSAWEGLKAFGKENNLKEKENYDYVQSKSDKDYAKNFNDLAKDKFNLVFGIGFLLQESLKKAAEQNPDTHFSLVDSVVDAKNVASLTFAEHEGSFLVGVVAGLTTKTKKVGFVGGVDSELIKKFEAGFEAGVHAVDPSVTIDVTYTEAFDKVDLGKVAAGAMYSSGVDVIYHAAGATGNGIFEEAKDIKKNEPTREIWVIGVDRDQYEEGLLADGKTSVTLTSMMKRVDLAVKDVSQKEKDGKFPGGETLVYDLKSDGVGISPSQQNLTDDIIAKVAEYTAKIKSGEIVVPKTPTKK